MLTTQHSITILLNTVHTSKQKKNPHGDLSWTLTGGDLDEWLECLTANAEVATVLDLI
jgi:hypothetical protein